jgi:hypothetical protein
VRITITTNKVTREQLLRRTFFMLYTACGGPLGMGFLQAKDSATEDDVWNNVARAGDYPGDRGAKQFARGAIYGDYVFGRMMKWGVDLSSDKKSFTVRDAPFNPEYQGFARTYPNQKAIFDAAMKELEVEDGYKIEEIA